MTRPRGEKVNLAKRSRRSAGRSQSRNRLRPDSPWLLAVGIGGGLLLATPAAKVARVDLGVVDPPVVGWLIGLALTLLVWLLREAWRVVTRGRSRAQPNRRATKPKAKGRKR